MIVLIDNYDSFVHNLARYFEELGQETLVVRNDAIGLDDVRRIRPAAIVISPGPCTPTEAGISLELIRAFSPEIPILGVCLGHQAIAQALGGRVVRAAEPVHGRTSPIVHEGMRLFAGLPNPLRATRYHSLIVEEHSLPTELRIIARTDDGTPMALEHVSRLLFGVQFHPESILTEAGHRLLGNFLTLAGLGSSRSPAGDRIPDTDAFSDPADAWWQTEPF